MGTHDTAMTRHLKAVKLVHKGRGIQVRRWAAEPSWTAVAGSGLLLFVFHCVRLEQAHNNCAEADYHIAHHPLRVWLAHDALCLHVFSTCVVAPAPLPSLACPMSHTSQESAGVRLQPSCSSATGRQDAGCHPLTPTSQSPARVHTMQSHAAWLDTIHRQLLRASCM